MKTISALIIDTSENKRLVEIAIDKTLAVKEVSKVYTLSDSQLNRSAEFIKIPKIKSLTQYNEIIINLVPDIVQEDFLIIFQWDGFPIFPGNWDIDFLKYDFIRLPNPTTSNNSSFING